MVWIYVAFLAFVFIMLALDLGVFHRKAHVISVKEALSWSAVVISMGLAFSILIYFAYENHWMGLGLKGDPIDAHGRSADAPLPVVDGMTAALRYLTGYIVEESLSVDNIFVIVMIFRFFGVPALYQHRVLFWGILGALAMRGAMIALGAQLIARFHWILYGFGVLLIFTAYKMLFMDAESADPSTNFITRLTRKLFPVTDRYHGQYFLVRAGDEHSQLAATPGAEHEVDHALKRAKSGTLMLTPLALALVIVETTDLIFAVDSIPAVFAVTADPFLVFTSNVFAILGLRSLFFAVGGMMDKFRYLKFSLAFILGFVGLKMLGAHYILELLGEEHKHLMNFIMLGVILGILGCGILASMFVDAREARHGKPQSAPLEKDAAH
jgi:tellurite resistance protein TerC